MAPEISFFCEPQMPSSVEWCQSKNLPDFDAWRVEDHNVDGWDAHRKKALSEDELIRRKFNRLAERWKRDSMVESSATRITTHQSYLEIVGMGMSVVPLLLEEMSEGVCHWSTALRQITGENPNKPEDAGRLSAQNRNWLSWGRDKGLLR